MAVLLLVVVARRNRLPPASTGPCIACEQLRWGEARLRLTRILWERVATRPHPWSRLNRSVGVEWRGIQFLPALGYFETLPSTRHSCPLGIPLCFDPAPFCPFGGVDRARIPRGMGPVMRLLLYVAVPDRVLPPWTSWVGFDFALPLFGELRDWWGVQLRVLGAALLGRNSMGPTVVEIVRYQLVFLSEDSLCSGLRIGRLEVGVQAVLSPRPDVQLLGGSLSWVGNCTVGTNGPTRVAFLGSPTGASPPTTDWRGRPVYVFRYVADWLSDWMEPRAI